METIILEPNAPEGGLGRSTDLTQVGVTVGLNRDTERKKSRTLTMKDHQSGIRIRVRLTNTTDTRARMRIRKSFLNCDQDTEQTRIRETKSLCLYTPD